MAELVLALLLIFEFPDKALMLVFALALALEFVFAGWQAVRHKTRNGVSATAPDEINIELFFFFITKPL